MPITTADFDYICKLVRDQTGVSLSQDKVYLVESRLALVAKEAGSDSISGLVSQLRKRPFNPPLNERIIEALMTNETFFFRDDYPFQVLKTSILPELIKAKQTERTLNIWCGACSSGQEPYSIAMLLREYFPQILGWNLNLIATDISTAMLKRAIAGRYRQHEINRGLSSILLAKYFKPYGNDWTIKEEIRHMVEFRRLNLTELFPPMPQMDIIFLRNVLIYFDVETKRSILSRVKQVLHPRGYLFLGGGETTVNLDNRFEPVQLEKTVCYKLKT